MPCNKNYLINNNQCPQPGGMFPYLLGMGEMPPLCNQDFAVALTNHMLDNPNQGPTFMLDPNIDLQLQMQPVPQIPPAPQNTQANLAGMVDFLAFEVYDWPFLSRLAHSCQNSYQQQSNVGHWIRSKHPSLRFFWLCLCSHGSKAKLGWKTNDNPKHSPAHQLASDEDITNTFGSLIKLMKKTHRQKEVFMQVSDLVHACKISIV